MSALNYQQESCRPHVSRDLSKKIYLFEHEQKCLQQLRKYLPVWERVPASGQVGRKVGLQGRGGPGSPRKVPGHSGLCPRTRASPGARVWVRGRPGARTGAPRTAAGCPSCLASLQWRHVTRGQGSYSSCLLSRRVAPPQQTEENLCHKTVGGETAVNVWRRLMFSHKIN